MVTKKIEKRDVVIITYEGLYSVPLVEALLNNPNVNVIKILKSNTIHGRKKGLEGVVHILRKCSLLFVFPKLIEMLLGYMYKYFIHQNKRPYRTIQELSNKYNVVVEEVDDINTYDHSQHNGAILFATYFNQILSKKTIEAYVCAYNTHPAPLPEGRGMFSQFWLIKEKPFPQKYYQTIHYTTPEIDAGAIVVQKSILSTPHKPSMADYMNKVTRLGIDILKTYDFGVYDDGIYQTNKNTYYSFPTTRDVLDFWCRGCSFMRFRDIKNYLRMKPADLSD